MKKVIALIAAAVVLSVGVRLYAEEMEKDAPKKAEKKPMCCLFLEKATLLTKEQKAQAVTLHEECAKEECAEKAQAKFFQAVKALLTADQIAACKKDCEKNHRTGCPICSDAKPAAEGKE